MHESVLLTESINYLNLNGKSIIVDCGNIGNKDFTNKIMGNTNMVHNFRNNTYWWNGAVGADKNDTSTLQTEPFSYTGDGTFTVTGSEQLVNRSIESKLAKALKDKVKLNNKTVSVEDFNKMFE